MFGGELRGLDQTVEGSNSVEAASIAELWAIKQNIEFTVALKPRLWVKYEMNKSS